MHLAVVVAVVAVVENCLGEVLGFVIKPPVFHFSLACTVLVELASLGKILLAVVKLNKTTKRSVSGVTVVVVVVDKPGFAS